MKIEDFVIDEWRKRLRFLTDIVFATSMTIMILNLEIPGVGQISSTRELTDFILKQLSGMATFFIAFMTVSVYWMKHLEHFGITMKVNQTYLTFQLIFLALIMLVPFWSTYVSQAPDNLTIKLFFSANMILIGLFSYISMNYAVKNKLIYDKVSSEDIKTTKIQILTEPAIALLACGLGFINTDYWDMAFIMIPILFAARKKLISSKLFSYAKKEK